MTSFELSLLIASALFPLLGAAGVLIVTTWRRTNSVSTTVAASPNDVLPADRIAGRRLPMSMAMLGFLGGGSCAALLAIQLARLSTSESVFLRVPLFDWLHFSLPHSPTISFGLGTGWITAAVVSLFGLLSVVGIWGVQSSTKRPLSDDALLAISVLYAAAVVYQFATSKSQGLMAWLVVIVAVVALLRLARRQRTVSGDSPLNPTLLRGPMDSSIGWRSGRLEACGRLAEIVSRCCEDYLWRPLGRTWWTWCGEQVELLADGPTSTRQAATIFWVSAVLLTWIWAAF